MNFSDDSTTSNVDVAIETTHPSSENLRFASSFHRLLMRLAWPMSLGISATLHATILLPLVAIVFWRALPQQPATPRVDTIIKKADEADSLPPSTLENPDRQREADAAPRPSALDSAGLSDLIRREFQQALEQSQPLDASTRMMRLNELGARLQTLSTEDRVGQIAHRVAGALGIPSDSPALNDAASGIFDFNRAQLDNVLKETAEDGRTVYFGVLIDPAGRTLRTELNADEGAELHRLFETIRRFPLLENVYRKLVMSLLQRMLDEERLSATPESER